MLSRDAIFKMPVVLPREEVFIPEWNDTIWVKTLTGEGRDRLELEWEETKRVNFRARLVSACACDSEGVSLFYAHDIPAIGSLPSTIINRICDVAFRLNLFTKSDIDELEKKPSKNGHSDDLASDLPHVSASPTES